MLVSTDLEDQNKTLHMVDILGGQELNNKTYISGKQYGFDDHDNDKSVFT